MSKQAKAKHIKPNEASLGRWVATGVVGYGLGTVLSLPWSLLLNYFPEFLLNSPFGFMAEIVKLMVTFLFQYIGIVIAIRWIGKTSIRDFILGVGGKVNKKDCLTILGLYVIGYLIVTLPGISNIQLRGIGAGQFAMLFVFSLLFVWMQTSWEEFLFRGLFLRYACKNDIRMTAKAVVCGIIASLLFMILHIVNPEVTSQERGMQTVFAVLVYLIPGLAFYFADIYYKSLVPGLLLHWLNNFTVFSILSENVTAGGSPTPLVDMKHYTGLDNFISAIILYVPLYVYLAWKLWKKRKAA